MSKYIKLFGYGVVIWVVAFIVATVFVAFDIESTIIVNGTTTLITLIAVYLLARSLNISTIKEMLKYSISWIVVGLILDALITTKFTGWEFFSSWQIWISYALSVLVMLLAVKKQKSFGQAS